MLNVAAPKVTASDWQSPNELKQSGSALDPSLPDPDILACGLDSLTVQRKDL